MSAIDFTTIKLIYNETIRAHNYNNYIMSLKIQRIFNLPTHLGSLFVVIQISEFFFKSVIVSLKPVNFIRLKN